MQNSNLNALAQKLNEMKNPKLIGISVGKVTKKDPLTISIADGHVLLTKGEDLEVCEGITKLDPEIKKDDKVLVVPTADEQSWIVIDRIGD